MIRSRLGSRKTWNNPIDVWWNVLNHTHSAPEWACQVIYGTYMGVNEFNTEIDPAYYCHGWTEIN